ncbi:LegC family aminotransferase [Flagellimonas sp. 2504JD1-5]
MQHYSKVAAFIKDLFSSNEFIPLHAPTFRGNEKVYLNECVDSTFVSSVGKFVDRFEEEIVAFTGAKYAVAMVNGTAALHIALKLAGVTENDEVITQPLTFIATCNAISYLGAKPVFVDVDRETMGLSPDKLEDFLKTNTEIVRGHCVNVRSKRKIKAIVPMHTFGHPADLEELTAICERYNIILVEDSAESLGSYYRDKHTGTFGKVGVLSFNGNKTITTGGGGMLITNDGNIAKIAKHITTTAKKPHPYEYEHDMIGYNYRLPNLNSALGCAQMESLPEFLEKKRRLAKKYEAFFANTDIDFVSEREGCIANYWLNAVILKSHDERNSFLKEMNSSGVMTRPIWMLMNRLAMFKDAQCGNLENAAWLEERVVNIPSSVI